MKCPACSVTLLMSEKQGVEIDYCPECRGIWLDRGEIDKIMANIQTEQRQSHPMPTSQREERREYDRYQQSGYHQKPYKRKKKSRFDFIEDIFDLG